MIDCEENKAPEPVQNAKRRQALLTTAFAPDYRAGNPYQALLAKSLEELGVRVEFFHQSTIDFFHSVATARRLVQTFCMSIGRNTISSTETISKERLAESRTRST